MNESRPGPEKCTKLRLATWNVNKSLEENASLVFSTLSHHGIDIACLQETGLTDQHIVTNSTYILKCSGIPIPDKRKFQGVGTVVKRETEEILEVQKHSPELAERIMHCKIKTNLGIVHVINVYAPTAGRKPIEHVTFYEGLDAIVQKVPQSERLFIMGDFNAHVGAENKIWTTCLGQHGFGVVNSNGLRLLEFCSFHDLCIANTFFNLDKNKKVTFYSTLKEVWHQLDLIITRRCDLRYVENFEIGMHLSHTDHCIVTCGVILSTEGKRNVNLSKTPAEDQHVCNLEDCEDISPLIRFSLCEHMFRTPKPDRDLKKNWSELKKYITTLYPINSPNEFPAYKVFCKSLKIRVKKFETAQKIYKSIPDKENLKNVKDKKKAIKKLVNVFINALDIKNDQKEVIRIDLKNMLMELNDNCFDRDKALTLLVLRLNWSHFEKLPTVDEIMQGIQSLEKHQHLSRIRGTVKKDIISFLRKKKMLLFTYLSSCWKNGNISKKIVHRMIIRSSHYNFKLNGSNNVSGINVASLIGESMYYVLEKRLRILVSSNKSAIEHMDSENNMMTSLKYLQAKFRKNKKDLFMTFVDVTEIMDKIDRRVLLRFLFLSGCSQTLVNLIAHFIVKKTNDNASLAIVLKELFIYCVFEEQFKMNDAKCIQLINNKTDSKHFSSSGLRCGKKMVILTKTKITLKKYLESVETRLQCFKLSIFSDCITSGKSATQIINVSRASQNQEFLVIGLKEIPLETVVTNCGFIFAGNVSSEIYFSIHKAIKIMDKLQLTNSSKSINSKMNLYNHKVFKILVHFCKFTKLNTAQIQILYGFHVKSLRRIHGFKAKDGDSSLLQETGIEYMKQKIEEIRNEEHFKMINRSCDDITKRIYFGELKCLLSKKTPKANKPRN